MKSVDNKQMFQTNNKKRSNEMFRRPITDFNFRLFWKNLDTTYYNELTDKELEFSVMNISTQVNPDSTQEALQTCENLFQYVDKGSFIDSYAALRPYLKQNGKYQDPRFMSYKQQKGTGSHLMSGQLFLGYSFDIEEIPQKIEKEEFKFSLKQELSTLELELQKTARSNKQLLIQQVSSHRLKQQAWSQFKTEQKKTPISKLKDREIEYLQQTMIESELKQFAESMQRVIYKRPGKGLSTLPQLLKNKLPPSLKKSTQNKNEYLIEFDSALALEPFWIDYCTLKILNSLRDDVQVNSIFDLLKSRQPQRRTQSQLSIGNNLRTRKQLSQSIKASPRKEISKRTGPLVISTENENEYGYCHHCKQRKSKYILAGCNYNSEIFGAAIPASKTINNYTVYNIDVFNIPIKSTYTAHPIFSEQTDLCIEQYQCERYFCSFCLKTNYETDHSEVKDDKDWLCPVCSGMCQCSRCCRQDQLTKIRALYVSLGGDLETLTESESPFDQILYDNWLKIINSAVTCKEPEESKYFSVLDLFGNSTTKDNQIVMPPQESDLNYFYQIGSANLETESGLADQRTKLLVQIENSIQRLDPRITSKLKAKRGRKVDPLLQTLFRKRDLKLSDKISETIQIQSPELSHNDQMIQAQKSMKAQQLLKKRTLNVRSVSQRRKRQITKHQATQARNQRVSSRTRRSKDDNKTRKRLRKSNYEQKKRRKY